MEDELRLSLLFIGACFIVAVLAHGMWKIRKNAAQERQSRIEPEDLSSDEYASEDTESLDETEKPQFDDLGIGAVRVVSQETVLEPEIEEESEASVVDTPSLDDIPSIDDDSLASAIDEENTADTEIKETAAEPKLYGSVVSNPKPHMRGQSENLDSSNVAQFPEPPGYLLKEEAPAPIETPPEPKIETIEDDFSLDAQSAKPAERTPDGLGERAKRLVKGKRQKATSRQRQEPSLGDDQMNMFEQAEEQKEPAKQANSATSKAPSAPVADQEVLVLNVRAPDGEAIAGAALLPMLLTLGLKFGDQDIFHRHANANGKGPVLFSLANMFKPGVFDIDNLENFSTQGVSLFMILPIEGDPHQVFNMMHNAARKLADEFGAQVLDGRRSVLTKQGLQQYVEKIREFERKRMIAKH